MRKEEIKKFINAGLAASFVFACLFCFVRPAAAVGAFMYASPGVGTYAVNADFTVTINIDSGGEEINAGEGVLSFDPAMLEVTGVSKNNSIFPFWTVMPEFSNADGRIKFAGGRPTPGYNGKAGQVIAINFKPRAVGEARLQFVSGSILANDGQGTNILTSFANAQFTISPVATISSDAAKPAENNQMKSAVGAAEPRFSVNQNSSIRSSTHPDQNAWSRERAVSLEWTPSAQAENTALAFDNNPETVPAEKGEGLIGAKRYEAVKDGIWYFHLREKTAQGWARTEHYRVMIDNAPPVALNINIEEGDNSDWPVLKFGAKDDLSSIVKYEIYVGSLDEQVYNLAPEQVEVKLSDLPPGRHTAMVKAIDAAGNETVGVKEFDIAAIESPAIRNYTGEFRSSDKLFLAGKALPGASLKIHIADPVGRQKVYEALADRNGDWHLVGEDRFENGRYFAWAEAANEKGLKSRPSDRISFLVTPPVFARFGGFLVNYITVIASLLFLLTASTAAAVYIFKVMRGRLRKETVDVEQALHDNLEQLKEEVKKDLAELARYKGTDVFTKERIKTKRKIVGKIRSAESKVMKEIKDVEKFLQ